MFVRTLFLLGLMLLLGACELIPQRPAIIPQVSNDQLRDKARQSLAQGIRLYDAGNFEESMKRLMAALDHGVLSKEDQSLTRKYLAFIFCTSNRETQCRDEFRKALEINARFELSSAEVGHPIWGPVFAVERAKMLEAASAPAQTSVSRAMVVNPGSVAMSDGQRKYDSGEYDAAYKLFQDALHFGLSRTEQLKARKMSAFSSCLTGNMVRCRSDFQKIFDIDPAFDLAPAEAGHPMWATAFAAAKQGFLEKQAKEAAAKKP